MSRWWSWLVVLTTLTPCGGTAWSLEVTPANPVPPFSLVRVRLEAGERAWVLGSDLLPVDVERTATGLVFTGRPGRYAVLSFTETSQDQHLVEIAGQVPTPPTPPIPPVPPVPPTPPPHPVPNDLVNRYGLGLVSWEQAASIGKPAEARMLSQAFLAASTALHEHRMTIDQAAASVRQARAGLSSGWSTWELAIEPLLVKVATEQGMTVAHYRNYLYEIGKSLEIAGRVPVAVKQQTR